MTKEEFYNFYNGEMWNVACPHCESIVSNTPHYRDKSDENDYIICPNCGNKLYVRE